MVYETERLILRPLEIIEADKLLEYYERNRDFFQKWEPKRDECFYTTESMTKMIESDHIMLKNRSGIRLYIFNKSENRVIGTIALSNIVYGVFLSCFLGYKLDQLEVNQGKMSEALAKLIEVAFNEYKLHRIEANIIPDNLTSLSVVKKLGFVEEGLSRKYLKINGKWEDHLHYVLLNEEVE